MVVSRFVVVVIIVVFLLGIKVWWFCIAFCPNVTYVVDWTLVKNHLFLSPLSGRRRTGDVRIRPFPFRPFASRLLSNQPLASSPLW